MPPGYPNGVATSGRRKIVYGVHGYGRGHAVRAQAVLGELTRTCEVLVMAGEREMIREEHTEAIHEHLPDSELLFIPGGTHFVMQEKPGEVNAAILDFLQ